MQHIGRSNTNRSVNWHQSAVQSRFHNNSNSFRDPRKNTMTPLSSPFKQVMANENNSLLGVSSAAHNITPVMDATTTEEIIDFSHATNLFEFS